MSKDDAVILHVLDKIQTDISSLHNKFEGVLVTTTTLSSQVGSTTEDLKQLSDQVKEDIAAIRKHLGVKTDKQLKLERWQALGKIAGFLAVIAPGFISLAHILFS